MTVPGGHRQAHRQRGLQLRRQGHHAADLAQDQGARHQRHRRRGRPPSAATRRSTTAASLVGFVGADGQARRRARAARWTSSCQGAPARRATSSRGTAGSSRPTPTQHAGRRRPRRAADHRPRPPVVRPERHLGQGRATARALGHGDRRPTSRPGDLLAVATAPTFDPNNPAAASGNRGNRPSTRSTSRAAPARSSPPRRCWRRASPRRTRRSTVPNTLDRAGKSSRTRGPRDRAPDVRRDARQVEQHRHHPRGASGCCLGDCTSYLRKFGLGEPTGLGLPGETRGLVAEAVGLVGRQRYTMTFGQGYSRQRGADGVGVFATIANDGVRVPPSWSPASDDADGTCTAAPRRPRAPGWSAPEVAKTVREMLEGVVGEEGTAPVAKIPGYRVAGKTGTAQRFDPDRRLLRGYTPVVHRLRPRRRPAAGRRRSSLQAPGQERLRRRGRRPGVPARSCRSRCRTLTDPADRATKPPSLKLTTDVTGSLAPCVERRPDDRRPRGRPTRLREPWPRAPACAVGRPGAGGPVGGRHRRHARLPGRPARRPVRRPARRPRARRAVRRRRRAPAAPSPCSPTPRGAALWRARRRRPGRRRASTRGPSSAQLAAWRLRRPGRAPDDGRRHRHQRQDHDGLPARRRPARALGQPDRPGRHRRDPHRRRACCTSVRTTPEATDLQALLAVMRERGVDAVAMEVSSHALALAPGRRRRLRRRRVHQPLARTTSTSTATIEDYFARQGRACSRPQRSPARRRRRRRRVGRAGWRARPPCPSSPSPLARRSTAADWRVDGRRDGRGTSSWRSPLVGPRRRPDAARALRCAARVTFNLANAALALVTGSPRRRRRSDVPSRQRRRRLPPACPAGWSGSAAGGAGQPARRRRLRAHPRRRRRGPGGAAAG